LILTKAQTVSSQKPDTQYGIFRAGAIVMSPWQWKATVAGEPVDLTYLEYRLLQELIEARGNVMRRKVLLERVWGIGNAAQLTTRTVDVHMARLRKKLGKHRNSIITVRNVGYRMDFTSEWIDNRPSNK